jgi:putative SOS response-associated peptidase YedK
MTRTWINVKGQPIFCWAGLWDDSDAWGKWYSGVMTNCNAAIRPIHKRMPVLLHEADYDTWLHGSLADAQALKERCYPDELIEIHSTDEPWYMPKGEVGQVPSFLM